MLSLTTPTIDCFSTQTLLPLQLRQQYPHQSVATATMKETLSCKEPQAAYGPASLSRPPLVTTAAGRKLTRISNQRHQLVMEDEEESSSSDSFPSDIEEDDEDISQQGMFSPALMDNYGSRGFCRPA